MIGWMLIAVGWLIVGAVAVWLWLMRTPALRATVIVQLVSQSDEGLRGVLCAQRGEYYTLRNVDAVKVGHAPTRVDGEVVIHRDQVAFFQVVSR